MVLNNLPQNFAVYFPQNFFYREVHDRWMPIIKKMLLPYMSVEDYMNAQIQSIDLPQINMQSQSQQAGRYTLSKRPGMALDEAMDKSLSITFKLTEGYTSYFIMRQQFDLYFQILKTKPLYWSPICVDLLDDFGHAIITYEQEQITPETMSNLSLSYAAKLGSYNTFDVTMKYNYFNIWYYNESNGVMTLDKTIRNI